MSFFNNGISSVDRRRSNLLATSGFYDMNNFILGIGIIVFSILIFVDHNKYAKLFALVFLLAGMLNFVMGVKYFKRSEIAKTIALFIASVFLIVMTVISFIALW